MSNQYKTSHPNYFRLSEQTSYYCDIGGTKRSVGYNEGIGGRNPIEFPVFEIKDSSDENAITEERHPKETIITGNDFKLRRSSRNVGPPQFYGKRLYIDIIDENENQPGSAKNPIPRQL